MKCYHSGSKVNKPVVIHDLPFTMKGSQTTPLLPLPNDSPTTKDAYNVGSYVGKNHTIVSSVGEKVSVEIQAFTI